MADFQGKYNGDQIEQLLDKANDIDLTKYALKTDNAPTATKLQAVMLPSPVSLTVLSLRSRSRRLRRTGLRYSSRLTTRRLERLRLTERLSPTIPEPPASSFGASRSRTYRPTSRSRN